MSPNKIVTDLTSALATATSTVSDAARKLEEWAKQLDEKDTRLSQLEERLNAKEKELKDKEERLRDVEERVKWCEVTAKRLAENVAKIGPFVKLNVGGKRFEVSKATLLKPKGSYFEALLASDAQQNDATQFFIDRDPKYFRILVNYLREGNVQDFLSHNKPLDVKLLQEEFAFYQIQMPDEIPEMLTGKRFEGGNLLSIKQKSILAKWLPGKQFPLIYKGSRDGFAAATFHTKCDSAPSTLTVIQSEAGWIFGGYTSASWKPTAQYQSDKSAFIFTLTNPHLIPPTKYPTNNKQSYEIRTSESYGATFGGGHDIWICDYSNVNTNTINFPHTYTDTTAKGATTFTGSRCFIAKDIEVYSVST